MPGQLIVAALLLALASPAWAGTYCTTYAEKTLGRLQTLCADGTRAVSTFNKTLKRWETTVQPPPAEGHAAMTKTEEANGCNLS